MGAAVGRDGPRWRERATGPGPLTRQAGQPGAERASVVERRRVDPPLPERSLEVCHCRAAQLQLDVVPRRAIPVSRIDPDRSRITVMASVVPPPVAEVDPAGEGDVAVRP